MCVFRLYKYACCTASMYAVQVGLEAKSDPDAKTYLLQLMDELDGVGTLKLCVFSISLYIDNLN